MKAEVSNCSNQSGSIRQYHIVTLHPENAHEELQLRLLGLGPCVNENDEIALNRKSFDGDVLHVILKRE